MQHIYPRQRGHGSNPYNSADQTDCTVRAVVNATGKDYVTVYNVLKKHGRRDGHGATNKIILPAYTELGLSLMGTFGTTRDAENMAALAESCGLKIPKYVGMTLKSLLQRRPKNSIVCMNLNHAFAIVDGGLIDMNVLPAGTRITSMFEVIK